MNTTSPKSTPSSQTVGRKLLLLATVSVTVALLLACSVFASYGISSLRSAKLQQLSSMASLLATNSAAAVEFADVQQADRLLAALRIENSVASAGLFAADGTLIGCYPSRETAVNAFSRLSAPAGQYLMTQPIVSDGETIGQLNLMVDAQSIGEAARRYAQLSLLVGAGAWIAAVGVATLLQRSITRPIVNLAGVARQVADEGNYSLRVEGRVDGELSDLYRAFNGMLSQVETSKQELQEANDNLERRVAERTVELEKACQAAEAASRAKSDFLANMSHEIRTPLNAIMGFADLLRRGWVDSEEERDEMLATVHTSGRHLMTVINDILDLSKIESGRLELEMQRESPHHILSEVVSLMRVSFREKNLSLDYTWEGAIPERIETDGSRLRQILLNLLGNARKFTPSGGVQLIAKIEPESKPAQLVVDVIDTGVGIPEDKQDLVFEPFAQADTSVTRKFGGTGLGLSISRRLARMMGGDLRVASEPGKGSNFQLTVGTGDLDDVPFLPSGAVGDVVPTQKGRVAPDAEAPQLQGLRVLVVDDGLANRKLISLVLSRAGAELAQAENGKEACDLVLGGRSFDVILLDMQMPVMDGYTAAGRMRDAGVVVPIVALTAHAMKGDRERCLEAGCSDFLSKPVNADELLERMQTLLDQRRDAAAKRPTAGAARSDAPSERTPEKSPASAPIRSKLPTADPEFAEIVVDFVAALQPKVLGLEDAARRRDAQTVVVLAHWIKGAGGTSGFPCFTAPATQICEAARNEAWSEIERHLIAIRDYTDRLECPRPAELQSAEPS